MILIDLFSDPTQFLVLGIVITAIGSDDRDLFILCNLGIDRNLSKLFAMMGNNLHVNEIMNPVTLISAEG